MAYESDSEMITTFPESTSPPSICHGGRKKDNNQLTCKLCGSVDRNGSWSSISSDITADSCKAGLCFELCQRRSKMKRKGYSPRSSSKGPEVNRKGSSDVATSSLCNQSDSPEPLEKVQENEKRSAHFFPWLRKSKNQNKCQMENPTQIVLNKPTAVNGKPNVTSNADSSSAISGSSLVCIRDEDDSSDNTEMLIDESREVEQGINDLMREHFAAKSAAENRLKFERHSIFRRIFSSKDNRCSLYKHDEEKVEMELLNNSKITQRVQNVQGDEEDTEEVRDKHTSLSQFPFNRTRFGNRKRSTTPPSLLVESYESNETSECTETKKNARSNFDLRENHNVIKRNNNIGICKDCKPKMIGSSSSKNRTRTKSESDSTTRSSPTRSSTSIVPSNSITPMRSHSLRHKSNTSRPQGVVVSENTIRSTNNGCVQQDAQKFPKRSIVSFTQRQRTSPPKLNLHMQRSYSAKLASSAAKRRTYSVRGSATNQDNKTYTRPRTNTVGSCKSSCSGRDPISTVNNKM